MKSSAVAGDPLSPLSSLLDDAFAGNGLPLHLWERALLGPAREFLRRPGKQFRARLVETCWLLAGGRPEAMPHELPLVIELLHAGSLIVDDIEDQSATRRGAPALHRIYGTPVALNTGNWMYFWSMALLERVELPDERRVAAHLRAGRTMLRCHEGQALDLALKITELDQHDVPRVVRAATQLKTGALMELAAVLGAIAAGADEARVESLASFGRELGMGLQMLDDLGGLTSASRRHKGREDLRLARPTWPWAWAATATSAAAFADLQAQARAVVAAGTGPGDAPADGLADTLTRLVGATGKDRVCSSLALSLAVLQDALGPSAALDELEQEIQRLEESYG